MTTFNLTNVGSKDPRIDELMLKWNKLMDNAKNLGSEHRYKEKEYGIKWRCAYEMIMQDEYEQLVMKFGNPLEDRENAVQPDQLEVISALVTKDWKDVQVFYNENQIDMIDMLEENFQMYMESCNLLRLKLKNRNLHNEMLEFVT